MVDFPMDLFGAWVRSGILVITAMRKTEFLFINLATSAYQIEGGWNASGTMSNIFSVNRLGNL